MYDEFIYHNSQEIIYRKPFGAVPVGTKVKLSILTDIFSNVTLNLLDFDGNEFSIDMEYFKDYKGGALYSTEIDTSNYLGLLNYYFTVEKDGKYILYGNNEEVLGGKGSVYYESPKMYQITVYEKNEIPEWYKSGIIYQIFVDRFFNGNKDGKINNPKKNSFIYGNWNDEPMYIKNAEGRIERWDFYGGNLRGVIEKLDYLMELGITIIYLNPIFESSSCHKYDIGDYEKIDEMFGKEEDFKELCLKAKKFGIRIILDGVFSHTGADSKYFNKFSNYKTLGAYEDKKSPYYEWYKFTNYPDEYKSWWGIDNEPEVDELNPSYLNYMVTDSNSIVSKWIKLGASGWRLDVADELPDKFIELLKHRMKKDKPESVLIGETWEDASNKVSYSEKRKYLFGRELDSVTNYPLREIIIKYVKGQINSEAFKKRLLSLYENYPLENFYSTMNILGNHDTERILTKLDKNIKELELALVIQMSLPGVPLIYYGDEAGVIGDKDPSNRKTYPWGKEDNFIKDIYKKLIKMRRENELFTKGSLDLCSIGDNILIIRRNLNDRNILIVLNSSYKEEILHINEDLCFNNIFINRTSANSDIISPIKIGSKDYLILSDYN